ncbi:5740_t:CDS:1, partial [Acaulospora morrowiae]
NDLLVNEILLWENLVKWGIYQSCAIIQQQRDDHDEQFVICNRDGSSSSPRQLINNALCKYSSSPTNSFKELSHWTPKEFQILGVTLEKCIPLIRYLQISSGDFYKKVKPFSSILPIELYEDILQYHLVPGHQPSHDLIQPKREAIDSVIIERKHAALIASWVDKRDLFDDPDGVGRTDSIGGNDGYTSFKSIDNDNEFATDGEELSPKYYEPWDNPYEFKLLLRGSRDGFSGTEFHTKCDSKAATVTVLRVRGTGEIIGGFTPIHWLSQNTWGYTKDSFIFCLASSSNSTGIRKRTNMLSASTVNIVSRVRDPTRATNFYKNYGPSFGRDDLKMAGNFKLDSRCCCKQGDYKLSVREDTGYFSVDEYEVFQVVPRKSGPSVTDRSNTESMSGGAKMSNVDKYEDFGLSENM